MSLCGVLYNNKRGAATICKRCVALEATEYGGIVEVKLPKSIREQSFEPPNGELI